MSDQVCCNCHNLFNFLPFFSIAKSESILSINNLFIKHSYQSVLLPILVLKISNDLLINVVSSVCIPKQVIKHFKQNIKSKKEVLKCHIP